MCRNCLLMAKFLIFTIYCALYNFWSLKGISWDKYLLSGIWVQTVRINCWESPVVVHNTCVWFFEIGVMYSCVLKELFPSYCLGGSQRDRISCGITYRLFVYLWVKNECYCAVWGEWLMSQIATILVTVVRTAKPWLQKS